MEVNFKKVFLGSLTVYILLFMIVAAVKYNHPESEWFWFLLLIVSPIVSSIVLTVVLWVWCIVLETVGNLWYKLYNFDQT